MAKPIGTLGTIETLTVAGRVFTDLTNLIILHSKTGGQVYCGFRKSTGSAAYQVTTGKTLTVNALRYMAGTFNAAAYLNFYLVYGDNAVGWDSVTGPTTPIYECDGSSTSRLARPVATLFAPYWEDTSGFNVVAQKYLVQEQAAAGSVLKVSAFCYEA